MRFIIGKEREREGSLKQQLDPDFLRIFREERRNKTEIPANADLLAKRRRAAD